MKSDDGQGSTIASARYRIDRVAGRPRSFDRDDALLTARDHFWRNGYDGTTVAGLTGAIGITAPSLYAAFGDKEQLFDEAVGQYIDWWAVKIDDALDQPTAREGIAELLRVTACVYTDPENPPGCMVLTEPRLADKREVFRTLVRDRIARGIIDGDVAADADSERLADFLLAVMVGMSARSRDGGDATTVAEIADIALNALPTPITRKP
jgi:AcrR family transcriptional regulator